MPELTQQQTQDITWFIIMAVYLLAVLLSLVPTIRAYLKPIPKVKLVMDETQIKSNKLTPDELEQVQRNFSQMAGALRYWNKQVRQAKFFHYYALIWTTVGTILVPLLLPYVGNSPFAQLLITLISLHTALLLAFHRLLKPDRTFQGFRQIESGYYDLIRDMLDRPYLVEDPEKKMPRIDNYIEKVKRFRLDARRMETQESFPALDTAVAAAAAQQVSSAQGGAALQAASAQMAVIREQTAASVTSQVTTVAPPASPTMPPVYAPTVTETTTTDTSTFTSSPAYGETPTDTSDTTVYPPSPYDSPASSATSGDSSNPSGS